MKKSGWLFLLLMFIDVPGLRSQNDDQAGKIRNLMESYQFSQAINQAELVLSADSARRDIHMLKGKALVALSRYQQALQSFKKAFGPDSTEPRVLIEIAEIYRQTGDLDAAIKTTRKITELNQENRYFSLFLANLYLQNDDFKNAQSVYLSLYPADTNDFYVLKQLAGCFNEMKSTDSALMFYRKALQVKPYDPGVTMKLGGILIKIKDFSTAIALSEKYLAYDSVHPGILKLNGYARYLSKDYITASKCFMRALKTGDHTKFLYKYGGLSLYKQDKYDSAVPFFRSALEADTTDPEICFYFGVSHFRTFPVSDTGMIYLKKTLKLLMPSDQFLSTLYTELASAYNSTGWPDTAMIMLQKGLEANPKNNILVFKIAYQYDFYLHKPNEALPNYRLFLKNIKEETEEVISKIPQQLTYAEYARNRIKEISPDKN